MIYHLIQLPSFGDFLCNIVERIADFLPASPVTLGDIAAEIYNATPMLGAYIPYSVMRSISTVLTSVMGYKLLKILPSLF